ncbi:bifunctional LLM class flavin-dependent oxidoreductase/SDR family oxidoreductase [Streptomyces broussonetiae]|uniref:bifunctional LLM class flavin-dependent oxidoreductase/SDR family oxidoreductase n=1 Tax=Streptomyces broussonetiae TaxID=2686304 RepID=UPI0035DF5134
MKFSLMFFASDENSLTGADRYDLLIKSARFGDEHDFHNIWVPERHFTPLGSLYPNPAVLHAALARETRRIGLRAGSVVAPLHDPLRTAEEWAVVDNLSGGRVGISLASGWNPDDFAFFPERYATRNAYLNDVVPTLRALWRGEQVPATSGTGAPIRVRTYPRPVQAELPLWLTAASSPASFAKAGAAGANLLTHLLDQGVEGLAENIAGYRAARAEAGWDPAGGRVTVMLHTFVGEDAADVTRLAKDPYCTYLKQNLGLLRGLARSRGHGEDTDIASLPDEELTRFVSFLYDRFAAERSLIGSPDSCLPLVRRLAAVGVDELACLLDFGPAADEVLGALPHLDRLRTLAQSDAEVVRADADRVGAAAPASVARTAASPSGPTAPDDADTVIARSVAEVDVEDFFARIEAAGAAYGSEMRCLERLWLGEREVLGRLTVPGDPAEGAYEFHPALLDNAFLLLGALAPGALTGSRALALPSGVGTFETLRRPGGTCYSHVVRTPGAEQGGELVADVRLFDAAGTVARATGLRMRLVEADDEHGDPGAELAYRTDWTQVPQPPMAPQETGAGRWLVFADSLGCGDALAAELTQAGHQVDVVRAEGAPDPAAIRRALFGAVAAGALHGVAFLWPLDTPEPADGDATTGSVEQAQAYGGEAVLALIRAGLELDDPSRCGRLWLVTRGSQPAADGEVSARGVLQAPVWGLGRVLAVEQPDLWGGLVDLDPGRDADRAAARLLATALLGPRDSAEDQLAVRGGKLLAPRLVRDAALAHPADPLPRLDPAGTYVLTGGLGDLGLVIARHMARRGARHLVLTSRGGLRTDAQREAVDELTALGVRVHVTTVDVAQLPAVRALREQLTVTGLPDVVGVVHLAGLVHGALLADLDTQRLREVAAPKIAGSWNLHHVFGDARLFLLVSALPAVFGPVGVGAANYAAANAFVDALAHHRRARGDAGSALGYGPWNHVGLAVREEGLDQLARVGVGSMAPAQALEILDRVLDKDPRQTTVARLDWATVFAAFPTARHTRQFAGFLAEAGDTGSAELLAKCAGADAAERTGIVAGYLTDRLAAVLGTDAASLDAQQPITELGLDSLMSLDMRNRIRTDLGVIVPIVRFLEGVSVEELTTYVLGLLADVLDEMDDSAQREEITL